MHQRNRMSYIFGTLLVLALLVTILVFCAKGLARLKRESVLAGKAAALSLSFTREDSGDLPGHFPGFSLMSCGHSRRAYNIAHGQVDGCEVQAFDFRYEIGHGSRRRTRHHGVIMVRLRLDGRVCMWSGADVEHFPLIIDRIEGSVGNWSYAGNRQLAERLSERIGELASSRASIELRREWLMIAFGVDDENWWDYSRWLAQVVRLAKSVANGQSEGME